MSVEVIVLPCQNNLAQPSPWKKNLSTFEGLPSEIKLMVLKSLSNLQSLLACIAASPDMFHLYCSLRDQVFTAVVENTIGGDLLRQAMFLARDPKPRLELEDFTHGSFDGMSVVDAKALLRAEKLTRNIIQYSVDDELEQEVQLSEIEWLRLRRGLYNFRVMVRLSQSKSGQYWNELRDVGPFCRTRMSHEILEMLYVLYCLRNRFRRHLESIEESMLYELKYDALIPDFNDDHDIFSKQGKDYLFYWNSQGPWEHRISRLHDQCQTRAEWSLIEPDLPEEWEDAGRYYTFSTAVPEHHDFDDATGNGFRWLNRYNKFASNSIRYDYHCAIPLGFMIWDDKRLEGMSWMRNPPPLEPIPEKWYQSYQKHKSVEERFLEACDTRLVTGEQLNTWMDRGPICEHVED